MEWDMEESEKLTTWYIDSYFKSLAEESCATEPLQEKYNFTLLHTLSLWSDVHCLCPLIRSFNLRCLQLVDNDTVSLILPQLLFSIRSFKDESFMETLLDRLSKSPEHTIKLFWILVVEIEREALGQLRNPLTSYDEGRFFNQMIYHLMFYLGKTDLGSELRGIMKKQGHLVERLVDISGRIRQSRSPVGDKKKMLRGIINDSPDLLLFDPIPLPIKCSTHVIGLVPEQCSVFHSQMNPLLLTFLTKEGKFLKCIFKSGDDLRQDSLVSQILAITCRILRSNGFQTKDIVTYEIVSTGNSHGFVEFVESDCLDNIFQKQEGLGSILRKPNGKLDEEKMARFVDSTAYYTVISYLLCVGDRHLDNILMTQDGRLFHIDYGFLGREPKPFAPLIKLCPEMIDIMGGKYSGYYSTFVRRCVSCYVILRKNAHIILDCIELMLDADIADVNAITLSKIKERFCLDMPDNDAIQNLIHNIEKGFEMILPQMLDSFHHTWKIVQGGGSTEKNAEGNLDDWLLLDPE